MSAEKRINEYKNFIERDEKEWKGSFYFVQGADTQFGLIERYLEKKENYGWEKEKALARKCVEKINRLKPKPKFFVLCGDLCDAYPEWTEIRKQQEADFWNIFKDIDPSIPLVCVCGNHDVGDQPTKIAVEKYRSSFGDDYFSFWVGGVLFIVINSQYFFDDTQIPELAKEQEEWLDTQLEKSKMSRHGAVLFQHIPWFLTDPGDEKEAYFAIPYPKRKVMLEKLHKAGVRYIFAGHLHRNLIGHYKDIESVVTSAVGGQIGNDKSGFRIVKVLDKQISHTYYPFDEAPETVGLS